MGQHEVLRRMREISFSELISRSGRAYNVLQERMGLLGKYSFDGQDLSSPNPVFGFEMNPDEVRSIFLNTLPLEYQKIIDKAECIRQHHFDLLGYKNIFFGDPIDWSYEPISDKRIPLVHWSKISALDSRNWGDLKLVWELNRHQHFMPLGQAYFLTKNESYAEEIVEQMRHWWTHNPAQYGPNWASSLEVSFRLISWAWALRLIRESRYCTRDFLRSSCISIGEHARHIERFLSYYYSPNTHLTGEALGLFYAGVCFPNLKGSTRWREKGKKILRKTLGRHILEDGGYVERTMWYHLYTVNIYLHFFVMSATCGEVVGEDELHRFERSLDFLVYSIKPDGSIPMIGDDDGGSFLPLSTAAYCDPRGTLAVGSAFFGRGDFKYIAETSRPETLWLLGTVGERSFRDLESHRPSEMSKAFPETGYFFLRSSWEKDSRYLAFDCGIHGWLNCGHAHADMLSIQVAAAAEMVIVDPGTYLYVNDEGLRDSFRGPEGHATVLIDGSHPAIPKGVFSWKNIPVLTRCRHCLGIRHDYLAGGMKMKDDVEWIREIHFIKPDVIVMIDTIHGRGRHWIQTRLPLHGSDWALTDRGCWQTNAKIPYGLVPLGDLAPHLTESWYSVLYGRKETSKVLVREGSVKLPFKTAVLIDLSGLSPVDDFLLKLHGRSFELDFRGARWIGFGMMDPTYGIEDSLIETDCQSGLLERCLSSKIKIRETHGGSYLRIAGSMQNLLPSQERR